MMNISMMMHLFMIHLFMMHQFFCNTICYYTYANNQTQTGLLVTPYFQISTLSQCRHNVSVSGPETLTRLQSFSNQLSLISLSHHLNIWLSVKIHLSNGKTSVLEKLEPKIPFYLLLSCYRCCRTIICYQRCAIIIIITSGAGHYSDQKKDFWISENANQLPLVGRRAKDTQFLFSSLYFAL